MTGGFELQTVNTSITEFVTSGAASRRSATHANWRLVRYNDAAHLAGLPGGTATGRMRVAHVRTVHIGRADEHELGGRRCRFGRVCGRRPVVGGSRSTGHARRGGPGIRRRPMKRRDRALERAELLRRARHPREDLRRPRRVTDRRRRTTAVSTGAWSSAVRVRSTRWWPCAAILRSTRRGAGTTSTMPGPESLVPCELADESELGPVDRALLASSRPPPVPLTRRDGRRVSSADAYLTPAFDRPNLVIAAEQVVDTVVIDRRRAVGVRLADGSTIDADHVVVAAGSDPLAGDPAPVRRRHATVSAKACRTTRRCRSPWCCANPSSIRRRLARHGILLQHNGFQLLPLNHLGVRSRRRGLGVLMAAVMRPHGRSGIVRLASRDPFVQPEVRFNLLHDPRDVDLIIEAAQLAIVGARSAGVSRCRQIGLHRRPRHAAGRAGRR